MKTSTSIALWSGCCALAIAPMSSGCYYKPTEVHQSEPGVAATVTTYSPGYVMSTLPTGYETRVIRGTTYYTYHGTYFRPHARGYVVVESP